MILTQNLTGARGGGTALSMILNVIEQQSLHVRSKRRCWNLPLAGGPLFFCIGLRSSEVNLNSRF